MNRLIISLLQAPVACALGLFISRVDPSPILKSAIDPAVGSENQLAVELQQVDYKRDITRSCICIRADARFMFSRIKFLT